MTDVAASIPRGRRALARVSALLALASAAVHLSMLDTGSLGLVVMAAMALACLPCAWHLWHHPTPRVWGWAVGADLAMLVVHVHLMAGAQHKMHMGTVPGGGTALPLALVVTQLALAAVVGLIARPRVDPRTRRVSPAHPTQPITPQQLSD